jgi:hypothetical protein
MLCALDDILERETLQPPSTPLVSSSPVHPAFTTTTEADRGRREVHDAVYG